MNTEFYQQGSDYGRKIRMWAESPKWKEIEESEAGPVWYTMVRLYHMAYYEDKDNQKNKKEEK